MATVLIVDDSADVRELLSIWVAADGNEVLEAATGEEALELVEQHQPGIVILDVMMPRMSGIEACERIRAQPSGVIAYIIMLSAKSETADKISGLETGADAYLTKPFEPAEVIAQLHVGLRTVEERRNAILDPLTGLFGRRAFDLMLDRTIARSNRHRSPLSLVVVDIDHFKAVNDTHGHAAGDEVLADFADMLRQHCRDSDLPFRWGGEEFAWLLSETDTAGAMVAAQRFRAAVEFHRFPKAGRLTVSAGITEFRSGDTPEDLFKRADAALYRAKSNGRNRVESSEDLVAERLRA